MLTVRRLRTVSDERELQARHVLLACFLTFLWLTWTPATRPFYGPSLSSLSRPLAILSALGPLPFFCGTLSEAAATVAAAAAPAAAAVAAGGNIDGANRWPLLNEMKLQ